MLYSFPNSDSYKKISISMLNLHTRTIHALNNNDIYTLFDLLNSNSESLLKIPDLGITSIDSIKKALDEYFNYSSAINSKFSNSCDIFDQKWSNLNIQYLNLPPKAIDYFHNNGLTTIGETLTSYLNGDLSIEELDALLQTKICKRFNNLLNNIETPIDNAACPVNIDRGIDYITLNKLVWEYGISRSFVYEKLGYSRQQFSIMAETNKKYTSWVFNTICAKEEEILLYMVQHYITEYSLDNTNYYLLTSKFGSFVFIILENKNIKCYFQESLTEDLQLKLKELQLISKEDREILYYITEKVHVLGKENILITNMETAQDLAKNSRVSLDTYMKRAFQIPYITNKTLTDEYIVQFLKNHMIDGRVNIPHLKDAEWLYSYCQNMDIEIGDLVKLLGYECDYSDDNKLIIEYNSNIGIENDMIPHETKLGGITGILLKNPLIGNCLLSESITLSINNSAKNAINNFLAGHTSSITNSNKKFITLSVINYAKNWDGNEAFWDYMTSQFGLKGNQYLRTTLCDCIKEILVGSNRLFIKKDGENKYRASIAIHALAPSKTWFDFFDFLYDFYINNMAKEFVENDPLVFKMVILLRKKFLNAVNETDEDFELGSKTYLFWESVKKIIIYRPKFAFQMVNEIIRKIDSLYYEIPMESKTYLDQLCVKWWSNKLIELSIPKERKKLSYHLGVATDITKIKPAYSIDSQNKLIIKFPFVRLSSSAFDKYEKLVYIDNQLVKSEKIAHGGNELGVTLYGFDLNISDYLYKTLDNSLNIRIVIKSEENIIYDSNDTLYRKYIVLKNQREVPISSCTKENYTFISFGKNTLNFENADVDIISNSSGIILYNVLLLDFFTIKYQDEILHIDTLNDKEISVIVPKTYKNIRYIENQVDYLMLKESESLSIIFSNHDAVANFKLMINGKNISFDSLITSKQDNYIRYSVPIEKEGKLFISIIDMLKQKSIFSNYYCLIKNFKIKFSKSYYFSRDDYTQASALLFLNNIPTMRKTFSEFDDVVDFQFNSGNIETDIPKVKIYDNDNHDWSENNFYWINDIPQSKFLHYSCPEEYSVNFYLNNFLLEEENNHSIGLGNSVRAKQDCDKWLFLTAKIGTALNETNEVLIASIATKETFIINPTIYTNANNLYWDMGKEFIGERASLLNLEIASEDFHAVFPLDINSTLIKNNANIPLGKYSFSILKKSDNPFLPNNTVLGTGEFYSGDENQIKFNNKQLKIYQVTYNGEEIINIQPSYIDNIHYEGLISIGKDEHTHKEVEKHLYTGIMFYIDRYGNRHEYSYDYSSGPDGREYEKVNPVRIIYINNSVLYITNSDTPEGGAYGDGIYFKRESSAYDYREKYRLIDTHQKKDSIFLADYYYYIEEDV